MDDTELMAALAQSAGAQEIYRLHATFVAYRDGTGEKIRIEVLDRGPGHRDRWSVKATSEDTGAYATGNGEADLKMAILTTHWEHLNQQH
ncbi:MAG TPA: hypothetical protein VE991_04260 [Acidimicrobiales bacterium]|nr:hypothetical protein [Acidimicrobiales bacterium]